MITAHYNVHVCDSPLYLGSMSHGPPVILMLTRL